MPTATARTIAHEVHQILTDLEVPASVFAQGELAVHTPITGEVIGHVARMTAEAAEAAIAKAHEAFLVWRSVPAPKRGELIRILGEELRANLQPLGRLVTIETGKILSEGLGEVATLSSGSRRRRHR